MSVRCLFGRHRYLCRYLIGVYFSGVCVRCGKKVTY